MADQPVPSLTLSAGDVLDVKFFYLPELDESQIVRPDGFMTLQLIGDISVQGKTPAELHRELLKRYATHLKNPNLTIMVRRMNDSRVWVSGEVKRPGPVQMPGRMTVLEAVMDVGGGTRPTADMKNVLVVRQRDGRNYGCVVNLYDVLKGKEGASSSYSSPGTWCTCRPRSSPRRMTGLTSISTSWYPKVGACFFIR